MQLLELLSNGSLISPAAKIGTFEIETKKRISPPGIVFRQKGAAIIIISVELAAAQGM